MEQQQELITFDQDKAIVAEHYPGEINYPRMGLTQHTDASIHSIVSFLRRPQLISRFDWSINASRSENLLLAASGDGLMIPRDILTDQYLNKLDGFTSMKATCVVKLEINAHPFQAGRLVLVAAPMPTILGTRKDFLFSTVGQAMSVNHVQMDISKQTEVELKIPFISPYNSYDLIDGKFDWAEMRVLVYSPLNSTEAKSLECILWVHFEDIELGYPTSGLPKPRQQSNAVQKAREMEAKGEKTGALGDLGGRLVAGITRTINGVTEVAGGLSSIFGWSKPILAKPGCTVLNRPEEGFANMDGIDHSYVLAMSTGNAVDYYPNLSSTRIDETSFEFLKRIPQFIGVFEYSKGSTYGTKLWECAVSPSAVIPACYYIKQDSLPTLSWKQPTILNYITSPFLYWTGSLVYTFRFVKTDFHSGRVEVSFHPFVTKVNEDRMDYVYKAVVDLRTNAEVSIVVPYVSPQQWKRINTYLDPVNPNPPDPGRTGDVITGILYIRALTPLLCANSIIGEKIEVLVEMRAGADFLVHAPVTSRYLPFSFDVPKQQGGKQSALMGLPKQQGYAMQPVGYTQLASQVLTSDGGVISIPTNGAVAMNLRITCDLFNWSTDDVACYWALTSNMPNYDTRVYMSGARASYTFDRIQATKGEVVFAIYVDKAVISRGKATGPRLQVSILATPVDWWPNPYKVSISEDDLVNVRGRVTIEKVLVDEDQAAIPVTTKKGLPLSIAQEEGGKLDVVVKNVPLDVKGDLKVDTKEALNVEITGPLPLPVIGDGGGGGGGGVVTIDPDSLPLWVSQYPKDSRRKRSFDLFDEEELLPKQQSYLSKLVGVAGTSETRTNAIEGWLPPSISGLSADIHREDTRMICSGEKFDGIRQMTRRFSYFLVNSVSSKENLVLNPVELIRPGIITERKTDDKSQYALYAPNSKSEVSGSCLNFYSSMYAFFRGGQRIKVWLDPRNQPKDLVSAHLEYSTQTTDKNVIDDNIENFMTPIAYELPKVKQMGEYQIPYYSPTALSSHWAHAKDNQFDTPIMNVVVAVPSGSGQDKGPIKVAAAAADDFDLQTFIGTPPVINILDLQIKDRQLHYPPTGFTPTQNVTEDPDNPEKPATAFTPIPYKSLVVRNNALGASCPKEPSATRISRSAPSEEMAQDREASLVTRRLLQYDSDEGFDVPDSDERYGVPPHASYYNNYYAPY